MWLNFKVNVLSIVANICVLICKTSASIFEVKVLLRFFYNCQLQSIQAIKDRRFHLTLWPTWRYGTHIFNILIVTDSRHFLPLSCPWSVCTLCIWYCWALEHGNSLVQVNQGTPGTQLQNEPAIFLSSQVPLPLAVMAALFLLRYYKTKIMISQWIKAERFFFPYS